MIVFTFWVKKLKHTSSDLLKSASAVVYNIEELAPTPSTHHTSIEEQSSTTLWYLVRMRNSVYNTTKRKQKLSTKRI